MSIAFNPTKLTIVSIALFSLVGCQTSDLLQKDLALLIKKDIGEGKEQPLVTNGDFDTSDKTLVNVLQLAEMPEKIKPEINFDLGFARAMAAAIKADPKIQMAKTEILNQQALLGLTQSQLDFQFSGTVYAGIEDVTDQTNGVAAILNASKMIYDGGKVSFAIRAKQYELRSAIHAYNARLEERALEIGSAWVELERYQNLNALITSRLAVLEPLIKQLQRIADAGVGDATQVAAAQRTVSIIRVAQTEIQDGLAQAELNFIGFFGELPLDAQFDVAAVATAIPENLTADMAISAPSILAAYAAYMGALMSLEAAKSENNITVGFESKVQRPFGQSEYDSDETIGFVFSKTLADGKKTTSQIEAAESYANRQHSNVQDLYRQGKKLIERGMQSISSMEKAGGMALSNAKALEDEIQLLKKQLVIGQSTLDSVLSAEARLYDAESQEIHFLSDKLVAQLTVLSAIGQLSSLVGITPYSELN